MAWDARNCACSSFPRILRPIGRTKVIRSKKECRPRILRAHGAGLLHSRSTFEPPRKLVYFEWSFHPVDNRIATVLLMSRPTLHRDSPARIQTAQAHRMKPKI